MREKYRYFPVFLLFFLMGLAGFATGEELDEFSLEELGELGLSNTPHTVTTTTATKTSQTTTVSPSVVRIITAEDIGNLGYQTLGEILNGLPGLYTTTDGLSTYLGVRGLGRPADYNTRVLILIDGIRLNDNIFDSALVGREIPLDVALIERVEYAPGPGSSVYGKNAFFGVVNIITRGGGGLDGLEFSVGGGSDDTGKVRVSYGKRFENGADVLLSATGYQHADMMSSQFTEFTSYDSDRDKNITFLGAFNFSHFHAEVLYGRRNTEQQDVYEVLGSEYTDIIDERLLINGRFAASLSSEWQLEISGTYGSATYSEAFPYLWYYDGNKYEDRHDYIGSWLTGEVRLVNTSFENHRILFGVEAHTDISMEMTSETVGEYYYDRWFEEGNEYATVGIYLQDEFALLDNLTLILGARFDDTSFEDEFNPRVGLIWQPWETTTAKLLYGSAFRSPNFFEAGFNHSYDKWYGTDIGDPKNEIIETYEVIIEQYLNDSLKFTAAAYYYHIENIIDRSPSTGTSFNGDDIDALGLELEVEKRFSNGIRLDASYCLQRTEDDDGDRLSNSPAHMAKVKSVVPLWFERGTLGGEVQYIGERIDYNENSLDDYVLGNLTFTYGLTKDIDISASVYNIGDTSYSSASLYGKGRGLSFFLQMEMRF